MVMVSCFIAMVAFMCLGNGALVRFLYSYLPLSEHRRSTALSSFVFSAGGPMDEQSEAWPRSSPGQQLPGYRVFMVIIGHHWPSLL